MGEQVLTLRKKESTNRSGGRERRHTYVNGILRPRLLGCNPHTPGSAPPPRPSPPPATSSPASQWLSRAGHSALGNPTCVCGECGMCLSLEQGPASVRVRLTPNPHQAHPRITHTKVTAHQK